jgi:hypothetical protein
LEIQEKDAFMELHGQRDLCLVGNKEQEIETKIKLEDYMPKSKDPIKKTVAALIFKLEGIREEMVANGEIK